MTYSICQVYVELNPVNVVSKMTLIHAPKTKAGVGSFILASLVKNPTTTFEHIVIQID